MSARRSPSCLARRLSSPSLGRISSKSDETRGRDDPRLTHPAAEGLSDPSRLVHGVGVTDEHRTDGGGESLGQTEHDGVAALGDFGRRDAKGGRRVVDARAVEVNREMVPMRHRNEFAHPLHGP